VGGSGVEAAAGWIHAKHAVFHIRIGECQIPV
jgi:hypothetical protein